MSLIQKELQISYLEKTLQLRMNVKSIQLQINYTMKYNVSGYLVQKNILKK